MLGNLDSDRLSIVSFVVRRPGGMHLHHNLVVALLNDLFGIQSRGGCSCAGPYGHRLLGIDIERSHEFEREISHGCEGIKPGWVRINFNYFISEPVFRYIVEAVGLLADHGWSLIDDYRFDAVTGLWRHRAGAPEPPLRLDDVRFDLEDGTLRYPHTRESAPEAALDGLPRRGAGGSSPSGAMGTSRAPPGALGPLGRLRALRWFELPSRSVCVGLTPPRRGLGFRPCRSAARSAARWERPACRG